MAGTDGHVDALTGSVRDTAGAVLVKTGCLNACSLAAVAVIGHRGPGRSISGPALWLSGVERADRDQALAAWVETGGPGPTPRPDRRMPDPLRRALVGLGRPVRFSPAQTA